MDLDFIQVDAFARQPLFGNPAAVVFDADDLPVATMQRIAREMNLSETVFVQAPTLPGADYRVRIFTPACELRFAGHPTLATAHAMRARHPELAAKPVLRQECGIGLVPVEAEARPEGLRLTMTQARPVHASAGLRRDDLAAMLGCAPGDIGQTPAEVVSTGSPWLIVPLARLAAISALAPDLDRIARISRELAVSGITVFAERGAEGPVRFRLRSFAPHHGVAEDPVCGSGNGAVAAYVARHLEPGSPSGGYIAEQGIELGRDGEIHASWQRVAGQLQIRIGGAAATAASGQLHIATDLAA
ncbi:PhzF family phenazine biosynthesis protein [Poseidonocella sp. HB161398]|uniref:PhzF family phenazine biosynthesis protein n=1 Tax=Poseidonocella sp. HB161398 TaxID=2320855 RepID=UPI0011099436|nr:PhzF family phenazine biosynthesis protein [Poseidonocella sp. HB161398]